MNNYKIEQIKKLLAEIEISLEIAIETLEELASEPTAVQLLRTVKEHDDVIRGIAKDAIKDIKNKLT